MDVCYDLIGLNCGNEPLKVAWIMGTRFSLAQSFIVCETHSWRWFNVLFQNILS